ncbi:SH3 domain-containing protein [Marispirochaeta sp.]|jgi:hypothetical protein|uniref:SH3 domain-containing protein n=1 Tax=Marispirochaeta sp. TaxID=2038653 RepID=UPI0029C641D0|nr:SH3 domain-containing protein [Marispirochaeta sp.]
MIKFFKNTGCKKYTLFAVFSLILIFTGCAKEEKLTSIDLPPTSLLSMREKWGVIASSHLRMRNSPDSQSEVVTTFWNRRGVVLEVLSQSPDKVFIEGYEDYWYQVSYDGLIGWVFGAYVELYGSREQALRAARETR